MIMLASSSEGQVELERAQRRNSSSGRHGQKRTLSGGEQICLANSDDETTLTTATGAENEEKSYVNICTN